MNRTFTKVMITLTLFILAGCAQHKPTPEPRGPSYDDLDFRVHQLQEQVDSLHQDVAYLTGALTELGKASAQNSQAIETLVRVLRQRSQN
jgi:hypothetical protein